MADNGTRKCAGCKEFFLKEEMIFKPNKTGNSGRYYCKQCSEIKNKRNSFDNEICRIFGLKKPGPKIQAQRSNLKKNYDISDETIIEALNYCINIKKIYLDVSLGIVTPELIEEMNDYKVTKEKNENNFLSSIKNMKYRILSLPPNHAEKPKIKNYNLLDQIGDDF